MTKPVLPPPRRTVDPDAVDQTSEVFEPATDAREEQGDSRPKRLAAEVDPLCVRRFVGAETGNKTCLRAYARQHMNT